MRLDDMTAILTDRRAGVGWRKTCSRLKLSKSTYYRLLAEVERLLAGHPA